ncbi:MAG TPA: MFS transporter [Anaerolineales bacterium]|nr:MFS transporter [Anaerolineales bacterium]
MNKKKTPLLTRTLAILLFSMILANIGGQMYGPLLPLYVQHLGADISQIGLFFTLSMIAPLLFQIMGGWISDAIGRVQAIAIGSLAGLAGYIVFTIAPSWWWLLLAVTGVAMASSFVGPSFNAFVAEESTQDTFGKVFSVVQGIFLVVGVIGAPLGGFLTDQYGFRLMFGVGAFLYGLATIIRILIARKARKENKKEVVKPSFSHLKTTLIAIFGLLTAGGIVTWIFLSDGVMDISFNMIGQLFPLFMNNIVGISKTQLGILGGISSLATIIFIYFGGMLSDKFGERVGIVLGNILMGSAILIMLNVTEFIYFIGAWVLLGVGQALNGPAYNSLISKAVPEKMRGTAFGFFSSSIGILSLPSPFIGTMIWQTYGPKVPFYIPLVVMAMMIPVIWTKFKLPGKGGATGIPETVVEEASTPN